MAEFKNIGPSIEQRMKELSAYWADPARKIEKNGPNCEVVNDRAKLMMHYIIGSLLLRDPEIIEDARMRLRSNPRYDPDDIEAWERILECSPKEIARLIRQRGPEMKRMRSISPLFFPRSMPRLQSLEWRRALWRKAKRGVKW